MGSRLFWLAAAAVAGCSAAAPAPRPAAQRTGPGGLVDPAVAAEVEHGDDVPPVTDRSERLVLSRSGSIWMMGPDASDPAQLTVPLRREA